MLLTTEELHNWDAMFSLLMVTSRPWAQDPANLRILQYFTAVAEVYDAHYARQVGNARHIMSTWVRCEERGGLCCRKPFAPGIVRLCCVRTWIHLANAKMMYRRSEIGLFPMPGWGAGGAVLVAQFTTAPESAYWARNGYICIVHICIGPLCGI